VQAAYFIACTQEVVDYFLKTANAAFHSKYTGAYLPKMRIMSVGAGFGEKQRNFIRKTTPIKNSKKQGFYGKFRSKNRKNASETG
jgi:hypothetical protein